MIPFAIINGVWVAFFQMLNSDWTIKVFVDDDPKPVDISLSDVLELPKVCERIRLVLPDSDGRGPFFIVDRVEDMRTEKNQTKRCTIWVSSID